MYQSCTNKIFTIFGVPLLLGTQSAQFSSLIMYGGGRDCTHTHARTHAQCKLRECGNYCEICTSVIKMNVKLFHCFVLQFQFLDKGGCCRFMVLLV